MISIIRLTKFHAPKAKIVHPPKRGKMNMPFMEW